MIHRHKSKGSHVLFLFSFQNIYINAISRRIFFSEFFIRYYQSFRLPLKSFLFISFLTTGVYANIEILQKFKHIDGIKFLSSRESDSEFRLLIKYEIREIIHFWLPFSTGRTRWWPFIVVDYIKRNIIKWVDISLPVLESHIFHLMYQSLHSMVIIKSMANSYFLFGFKVSIGFWIRIFNVHFISFSRSTFLGDVEGCSHGTFHIFSGQNEFDFYYCHIWCLKNIFYWRVTLIGIECYHQRWRILSIHSYLNSNFDLQLNHLI